MKTALLIIAALLLVPPVFVLLALGEAGKIVLRTVLRLYK